jgi:hypothetical protein
MREFKDSLSGVRHDDDEDDDDLALRRDTAAE